MKSSRTVAHEFLRLAREDGKSLWPMQVLKLAYIAHGWMLALYHRPLIGDGIEAWTYGPIIPVLMTRCAATADSRWSASTPRTARS